MSRPVLLDLFCGAGGAAMGYHRAGFDVVGVDIEPQPRYPFRFIQADVMDILEERTQRLVPPWWRFDAIHASPPCQQYTPLRARQAWKEYPDLIAPVRAALQRVETHVGTPFVIENVPNAPLNHYITLCGGMFGLRTYRHRRFETSWLMFKPHHPAHVAKTSTKKRRSLFDAGYHISITGDVGSWLGPACMGIDWMHGNELSQSIPPAYTQYIGTQLMAVLS